MGSLTLDIKGGMQYSDFLQQIDFSTPFRYYPAVGNLVVEYWFTGFSPQWSIDHQQFPVGTTRMILDLPDSSTAKGDLVLATQFAAIPVPEPTGLSIAAIAGPIILIAARKRNRWPDR